MKLADLVQLIAQAIWKTCSRTVNFDFCELKKPCTYFKDI